MAVQWHFRVLNSKIQIAAFIFLHLPHSVNFSRQSNQGRTQEQRYMPGFWPIEESRQFSPRCQSKPCQESNLNTNSEAGQEVHTQCCSLSIWKSRWLQCYPVTWGSPYYAQGFWNCMSPGWAAAPIPWAGGTAPECSGGHSRPQTQFCLLSPGLQGGSGALSLHPNEAESPKSSSLMSNRSHGSWWAGLFLFSTRSHSMGWVIGWLGTEVWGQGKIYCSTLKRLNTDIKAGEHCQHAIEDTVFKSLTILLVFYKFLKP